MLKNILCQICVLVRRRLNNLINNLSNKGGKGVEGNALH